MTRSVAANLHQNLYEPWQINGADGCRSTPNEAMLASVGYRDFVVIGVPVVAAVRVRF